MMTWKLTFWVLQECRWLAESMKFALTSRRHELDRNRSSKADRRFKFVSDYCSLNSKLDWNRSSKADRQSNLLFKQLITRFMLISDENLIKCDMWIWSNFITKHWLIETQKSRSSVRFVLRSSLIVYWSVRSLISVDTSTMMIRIKSVYWWCSLLLNEYEILIDS